MLTKDFILAGKAIFTVESRTGEYATFQVSHKEANGQWPETWFVALLTGPNNEDDYTYMGMLDQAGVERGFGVRLTKKSPYGADSKPVRVASWALQQIWKGNPLPEGYKIHHEGRCCRCGRTLTVPESIRTGIGPECARKMTAA